MRQQQKTDLDSLDDQALAMRARALELEILASVRSDNWNIEERLQQSDEQVDKAALG